ncbi:four-helix bundle copper-binding protein [Streptomyces fradiae]|uniref:four-helix bundle copper-binding protein n=1 Tax=Streptomyces fradiae TaxID=1906 RepID=UPI0033EA9EA9
MTSAVKDMLDTYPADLGGVDREKLARCIEECIACAQACTACSDSCLSEEMVGDLTKCVRTNADCADICNATAAVLSRHTGYDANVTRAILQACATVCKACGDECERHAGQHEHCRVCAEACRRCEQACNELIASLG